jgi:putative tricarboxylic transport membrane protein
MLPMLALGVPSSATAAVMMGGLMIWGLTPGPMLFTTKPDFVWGLIASMYVSNIVGVFLVLLTVPFFAALLRIPFTIIGPIIVAICFVGAYTVANSTSDLWLVLIFGAVGFIFNKLEFPLAPLVLAMVLGSKAEESFHQSMIVSDGSLRVFFSNFLVGTIMTIALALLIIPQAVKLFSHFKRCERVLFRHQCRGSRVLHCWHGGVWPKLSCPKPEDTAPQHADRRGLESRGGCRGPLRSRHRSFENRPVQ